MRRILSLLLAWALVLATPLSFGQVTVDGTKTGATVSSGTWAGKAAATDVPAGTLLFATDVGESGSLFQSTGTRWRAVNGQAALKTLGAASANIANSETIVLQTLIPAGAWQTNDILRIWLTGTKSGTTDTFNITVRVGTSGTTADTAITGLSAFALTAASGVVAVGIMDVKLVSATSAQKIGGNNTSTHPYQASSGTTAAAAATTITSAAANPLYVSVSIASSGATNTVSAVSGQIQLITP